MTIEFQGDMDRSANTMFQAHCDTCVIVVDYPKDSSPYGPVFTNKYLGTHNAPEVMEFLANLHQITNPDHLIKISSYSNNIAE